MKTLYILRHAEAAQGSPDNQRPLTQAGRAAAEAMGDTMREKRYLPAAIFCSPATRTRQTLAGLNLTQPKPVFVEDIYQAAPQDLLRVVHDADTDSLLLVGHNPAVHGLTLALAGRGQPGQLHALRVGFAPGTLAVLQFDRDWIDLVPGMALLADLVIPD
ncbi:MAG TPA: histidine phosphatase family protein [Patescibacteria group bacterium]|nr:histidine phosphatase family protein [Patescibacteria group bacterium]